MVAPGVRISIEYDVPVTGPDADIVLGGLMAYNAAHLPPARSRFVLVVGDPQTGQPAAGVTLVQWGDTAYSFWGIWSAPGLDNGTAITTLLPLAEAELARRNIANCVMIARSGYDTTPYLSHGFGIRQIIRRHINGRAYTVLQKQVVAAEAWPAVDGLSIAVHLVPPRDLAKEIWHLTDGWRQSVLGAPVKLVAAYVRDVVTNAPRGAALCYAVDTDFMVDMVWLEDSLRGTGTGFAMLAAALEEGRKLGCTRAAVETMDCQAPQFYPLHGFRRFGYAEYDVPGLNMNFYDMKL